MSKRKKENVKHITGTMDDKTINGFKETVDKAKPDLSRLRLNPNISADSYKYSVPKSGNMRIKPVDAEIEEKLYITQQTTLVDAYLNGFPDWKAAREGKTVLRRASDAYKKSTIEKIRAMIHGGVREPTVEAVWAWIDAQRDEGTRQTYYYAAKTWAAATGMPVLPARRFKPTRRKPKIYREDDLRKMLSIPLGDWVLRDRAIIAVAAACGLRKKEIRWLKASDVDTEKWLVNVRDYGQGLKSYQERPAPVPDVYRPYIASWLSSRHKMFEEYAKKGVMDPEWLFVSDRCGQMAEITIYNVLYNACKKAGLQPGKDINGILHSLRRTALSEYGRSGVSLGMAQQIAGHSSPLTTRQYQQFDETDLLAAAKKRTW